MVPMNKISRGLLTLGAATSLAILPACGSSSGSSSSTNGSSTSGKQLKIVTAFYPFQYATQQVTGDKADVSSLTAPGAEPHELELTARQVAELSKADLVIYEKGFQGAVDKAMEQAEPKNVLDVSTLVDPIPATGVDEDGHAASGNDPHIWLAPKNMQAITKGIADKVKTIDQADAAAIDENLKKADTAFSDLDKEFTTGLGTCQRKDFITSHAAFAYLAKAYGLNQIGISGLSPDEEPSPARIAEVQGLAKSKGITTIFYETLVSPAQAESIAGDLKLRTDVLDPIEGITKDSKGTDYIAVQQANLAALKTANGCK